LELGEPNIPEGIDRALSLNPGEVLVLPYFLTEGRHMDEDIPKILQEKARAYPETPIRLLSYVGKHPQIADLLAKMILEKV
jgi:sirohydrochlorin ferrochelatase